MQRYQYRIGVLLLSLTTLIALSYARFSQPQVPNYTLPSKVVQISIPPLPQHPLYPTGCESVAAVMALNHAGTSITVDQFIDLHLPCSSHFYRQDDLLYGPDPFAVFVGNPRSEQSYGCMAPVIERALASCSCPSQKVHNVSGTDLTELCTHYIDAGIPVITWATIDMSPATVGNSWFLENGRFFVWTAGEHCLLLVGYDDEHYYFNDPRYGKTVAYTKTDTERAYAALGKQALVIQ